MKKILTIMILLIILVGCKKIEPVSAEFEIYGNQHTKEVPILFSAINITDVDEMIWDFGDGTIYSQVTKTIEHTYSIGGNYTVTLTVSNKKYTDRQSKNVLVYNW